MLDKSGLAERMMQSMQQLFGGLRGGLAITVTLIGIILAASTGIVGASVVLLGLLGLPVMLKQGYDKGLASGTIASAGTLGILMPPSIMLVIMADRTGTSVDDLFRGALLPALLLGALYIGWLVIAGWWKPDRAPPPADRVPFGMGLLVRVSSTCFQRRRSSPGAGIDLRRHRDHHPGRGRRRRRRHAARHRAHAVERRYRSLAFDRRMPHETCVYPRTIGYVFAFFLGALCFSYVFQRLGGYALIEDAIAWMEAGIGGYGVIICVLIFIFLLGFVLDWIEITLIFLPLLAARSAPRSRHRRPEGGRSRPGVVHLCRVMPADVVPDAGRLQPVLPQGRRTARGTHGRHLPRRATVHRAPAIALIIVVLRAAWCWGGVPDAVAHVTTSRNHDASIAQNTHSSSSDQW